MLLYNIVTAFDVRKNTKYFLFRAYYFTFLYALLC